MLEIITRNIAVKVIEDNLDHLIRFAFFRLGDMSKAEDVVHEAVLRLLDHPPSLFKPGSLKSYLYRIVYNLCQDSIREDSRQIRLPIESVENREEESEEVLDMKEAQRISRLLENIPTKESEIIRMSVVDDLSFAEISRITKIPESTVKYRYKCGISKLRELLSINNN